MPMGHLTRYIFAKVQNFISTITANRIYIFPSPSHGHHDLSDILRSGFAIRTIFDVGANIGQSATRFRAAFPAAKIHCFEPVSSTFRDLINNQRSSQVTCHNLALAENSGQSRIYLGDLSVTNSMVEKIHGDRFEEINVETVDLICERLNIDSIDLLKIDAEGFDLSVLRGAKNSLQSGKIVFVLVEAGFTKAAEKHVSFFEIDTFLKGFEFELIGFYEQTPEWSGEIRLRFANVLYARQDVASKKRRA